MDDTVKAVEQRRMESSIPIIKTSAIVPMSQCEIGEMEGSTEDAKEKAMAKDGIKEGKVRSRSKQDDLARIPARTKVELGRNGFVRKSIGQGRPRPKRIKPEAGRTRPIRTEAKAAEPEVKVVKPATLDLQEVKAGEHEEESKQAHYHRRQRQSKFEGCYPR